MIQINNLELNRLNVEFKRLECQKSNLENQLRNIVLGIEVPEAKEEIETKLAILNVQMQQMAFKIQVLRIKLDKAGTL